MYLEGNVVGRNCVLDKDLSDTKYSWPSDAIEIVVTIVRLKQMSTTWQYCI